MSTERPVGIYTIYCFKLVAEFDILFGEWCTLAIGPVSRFNYCTRAKRLMQRKREMADLDPKTMND